MLTKKKETKRSRQLYKTVFPLAMGISSCLGLVTFTVCLITLPLGDAPPTLLDSSLPLVGGRPSRDTEDDRLPGVPVRSKCPSPPAASVGVASSTLIRGGAYCLGTRTLGTDGNPSDGILTAG